MKPVGMIQMSCDCDAVLFYFGGDDQDKRQSETVERFLTELGPGKYGVFTAGDGLVGVCPHCELEIELPDPNLMNWLPFLNPLAFRKMITELQQREGNGQIREETTVSAHYDQL